MRILLLAAAALLLAAAAPVSDARKPATAAEGVEPARPLTARGRENLIALARLYGAVRYFHPSDQARSADWDALAITGVQRVEGASDAKELAEALRLVFEPVAPTLALVPAGAAARVAAPPSGESGQWIAWRHEGVEIAPSVYKSARQPAPGVAPGETVRIELGGGLSAILPVSLYRGADRRTLPVQSITPLPPTKPEGFQPTGNDRATRLADVVIAWNVFQHFYPYFDVVKVDWPAQLDRALTAAATDPDGAAFERTLERLTAALEDGHGGVGWQAGPKRGSLPLSLDLVEGSLVVDRVGETAGGLKPGDLVEGIDGRKASEALAEAAALASGSPQWRNRVALQALTTDLAGKSATLSVRRAGKPLEVTLTYEPTTTRPAFLAARLPPVAELKPGLYYVDLDAIDDTALKAAMPELLAAKAVVFDMRGYPSQLSFWFLSTLSDQPMKIGDWSVPIASRPDRQRLDWRQGGYPLPPAPQTFKNKLVFIQGPGTISKAEVFMEIVAHYRAGEIVGAQSAGANGNINPFVLPGGYRVTWTGMKVVKHDGSRHHGIGITPTIPAGRTIAGVREGRDEVLEAAVKAAGF